MLEVSALQRCDDRVQGLDRRYPPALRVAPARTRRAAASVEAIAGLVPKADGR
jgi:hypothetical protein